MSTLQDEMAALNNRLDQKLDTLRGLRRLHKVIGLFLLYVFICLALIDHLFFHQQPPGVNESLINAISILVTLPIIYCLCMFLFYRNQLNEGQLLKNKLYSSFLNSETNHSKAIAYHNELEKINW
jgi:hypothetical protein